MLFEIDNICPGSSIVRSGKVHLHNSIKLKCTMDTKDKMKLYWKRNRRYLFILLSIWFLVSFVCVILAVDLLNEIRIGGFNLGFWFCQQRSIYCFVIIIFIYVRWMNKLAKDFYVDEK